MDDVFKIFWMCVAFCIINLIWGVVTYNISINAVEHLKPIPITEKVNDKK